MNVICWRSFHIAQHTQMHFQVHFCVFYVWMLKRPWSWLSYWSGLAPLWSRISFLNFISRPCLLQQDELQQKEERISILEEALTESVSIAAEREELLAQQAHTADTAAQKVDDLEAEVERTHFETAITNTKNASLVLALNENDIILSYYKSERHRVLEELLEMR